MPTPFHAAMARFLCGGDWPADYLAIDTETNGVAVGSPGVVPLELGWCLVRGGAAVDCGAVLLDWTRPAYTLNQAELAASIEKTAARMAERGKPYRITYDRLRDEGVDPAEGLAALRDGMAAEAARGGYVAGYNHVHFDMPLLDRVLGRYLGADSRITAERLLDCGLVEKRARAGARAPRPGVVPVCVWYAEARGGRAGGWSLEEVCRDYRLDVDPAAAHSADADARAVHLLIEHWKQGA